MSIILRVIRCEQINWVFEKASDQEIGCAKQMVYLVAITHMAWLALYLLAEHKQVIKPYAEMLFISKHLPSDAAHLLGSIAMAITGFILLLVYTKWRQNQKIKTRTHLNVLSVSIIAYCQYKVAVAYCIEFNHWMLEFVWILEFVANYNLAALFLFAVIPAKWMNDFLVIGFFVVGILALLPLYILIPLAAWSAYAVYQSTSEEITKEVRMFNNWLHRTLLLSRR